jgi:hypothetical protein
MAYVRQCKSRGDDAILNGTEIEYGYGTNAEKKLSPFRQITVKFFRNGNAHVIFGRDALTDINRALAEFYGDVLPDVDPVNPAKAPSTAVAKDLQ